MPAVLGQVGSHHSIKYLELRPEPNFTVYRQGIWSQRTFCTPVKKMAQAYSRSLNNLSVLVKRSAVEQGHGSPSLQLTTSNTIYPLLLLVEIVEWMLTNHMQCVGKVILHKVLREGVQLYNVSFSPVLASENSCLKNANFEPGCGIVSQGADRQSLDETSP